MKNVLIAAPIYDRAWILPQWIEFIEKQNYPKENIGFMFELGPDDNLTHEILWEWQAYAPQYKYFDAQIYMKIAHEAHPDGKRHWSAQKYYNMVTLRNNLLERATNLSDQFDYYFSLDSDIFLEDPDTILKLVNHAETGKDVLSPLMYMTPYDTNYPSAMTWENRPGGHAIRSLSKNEIGTVFKVDIVMAAVFMSRDVYTKTRYQWHRQGEDLGFATHLAELGFDSFAAWDIYCPHIMHKNMLAGYMKTHKDGRSPW
jgi:hypothetical protein